MMWQRWKSLLLLIERDAGCDWLDWERCNRTSIAVSTNQNSLLGIVWRKKQEKKSNWRQEKERLINSVTSNSLEVTIQTKRRHSTSSRLPSSGWQMFTPMVLQATSLYVINIQARHEIVIHARGKATEFQIVRMFVVSPCSNVKEVCHDPLFNRFNLLFANSAQRFLFGAKFEWFFPTPGNILCWDKIGLL